MISLILAVYNNKDTIPYVLDSIKNELSENDQLILIDDRSIDGTWEYLKTLVKDKFKFELILRRNEKNIGLANSLNLAIKISTKKYIARIDGDDIILKNRLKYQLSILEKNPHLDIISHDKIEYKEIDDINKYYKKVNLNDCQKISKITKNQLLLKNRLNHPTIMGKSKVFKNFKYNAFYQGSNDYKLWIDMAFSNVNLYRNNIPVILYMNKRNDRKKIIRQLIESIIIRLSKIRYCSLGNLIYMSTGCMHDILILLKILLINI